MTNSSRPSINQDQWVLWLNDPVTVELRAWAAERCEELRDDWEYSKETDKEKQVILDTFSKGVLSVLREIETPTPETILGVSFERTIEGANNGGEH